MTINENYHGLCGGIKEIRKQNPLIHCLTNYVTANDVANMILAVGASPVMADAFDEVADITRQSRALVLNMGTLNPTTIASMLLAGETAAASGVPVVFDPVGIGASAFRRQTAFQILEAVPCTVIRGNASEIMTLAGRNVKARGVDADEQVHMNDGNRDEWTGVIQQLSRQTGAIIVVTGKTDLIADANQVCLVHNGHPMMTRLCGTGCMLDGVIASFLGISDMQEYFWKTVSAVCAEGICGEQAFAQTEKCSGGSGSFRQYFFDAMSELNDQLLVKGANIEV